MRSSVNRGIAVAVAVVVAAVVVVIVSSTRRAVHTATAIGLTQTGSEATPSAPNWSDVKVVTPAGVEALPRVTSVAMIVSSTCVHCHRMLAAMAAAHAGPRMAIVTLQGRAAGDSLLKTAGLHAMSTAPSPNVDSWVRQTGVQSVPTFLWFDDVGHIKAAALGELSDTEIATWAARTH